MYCDECSLTSLKIPESLDASQTRINCENNVTYLTQKNMDFQDSEIFPDFDTGKLQKVVKLTKEQAEAGKSGTDIFDELKGSDYKLTDLQLGDRIIYTYDCGIGMSFDFTVHVGYSEEMLPPNRPDGTQYVEYTVSTVGDIPLPEGWKWKDEDADLVLPFGNWYEATAEYVGDNAEYYVNIFQDVEIWKDYCQHPNDMWELKDVQEADCTQNGYTGDYYCGVCGNLLYKGEYIPIQHRLELVEEKEATQTEPGNIQYFICSACGKLFLDEDGYHEVGIEDVTIHVLEPDPTDEPVPAPSEDPTMAPSAEPTEEPKPTEAPLPTPGVSETPVPTEEPVPTQKPEVPEETPVPTVPADPTVVPPVQTPVPTQTVQATQTPVIPAPTPRSTPKTSQKKPAKVGKIITSSAGYRFKVTSSKVKNPEVALYRPGVGRKEVKIGQKVKIDGISYSVTSVCERAFRSNKRVTKVSLGSRVNKIGKEAKELFREKGLSKYASVTTGKVN